MYLKSVTQRISYICCTQYKATWYSTNYSVAEQKILITRLNSSGQSMFIGRYYIYNKMMHTGLPVSALHRNIDREIVIHTVRNNAGLCDFNGVLTKFSTVTQIIDLEHDKWTRIGYGATMHHNHHTFLWSSKSFTLSQPANHVFIKINLLRNICTKFSHACCSLCR